jgi:hypothetical protein
MLPRVIARTWISLKTTLGALVIEFRNRDMGLLGLATAGTSFATWCFTIALGVYGFEAHGAAGVGVVALVRFLPAAIVSPLVGLLIDRLDRLRVPDQGLEMNSYFLGNLTDRSHLSFAQRKLV